MLIFYGSDRELFKSSWIDLVSESTGGVAELSIEGDRARSRDTNDSPARMVVAPEAALDSPDTIAPPALPSQTRLPPAKVLLQQEGIGAPDPPRQSPHLDSNVYSQAERRPSLQHPYGREHDRILPKMSSSPVNGHGDSNGHSQEDLRAVCHRQAAHIEHLSRETSRLNQDVTNLSTHIRYLSDQVAGLRQTPQQQQSSGAPADNAALELFTENLASVMSKVNEIEVLKMQIGLLKSRVAAIEGGSSVTSPAGVGGQLPPIDSQAPPAHRGHPAGYAVPGGPPGPSHHAGPIVAGPLEHRIPSGGPAYYQRPVEPAGHPSHLDSQGPVGWTTVNQTTKRPLPNGIESRPEAVGTPVGSPKRQKLAPLEPQPRPYEPVPHAYETAHDPQLRTHSTESHPESHQAQIPPPPARQYAQSPYPPPSANEPGPESPYPPGDAHRPTHNHPASVSPKRGRGGGRGRPRKSHPQTEMEHMVTAEAADRYSRSSAEWASSTVTPNQETYYTPITTSARGRGGTMRRGSGGAPPTGSPTIGVMRPAITASVPTVVQPMPSMTIVQGSGAMGGDPYAHTKKSRTKPTRNADGVLIRKDGRPDMRSQSSAANLRKVHARKEQERQMGDGDISVQQGSPLAGQPQSLSAAGSLNGSPSATPEEEGDGEQRSRSESEEQEAQKKHSDIMKKMFPEKYENKYGFPRSADPSPPADGSPVVASPATRPSPVQQEAPKPVLVEERSLRRGRTAAREEQRAEAMSGVEKTALPAAAAEQDRGAAGAKDTPMTDAEAAAEEKA